MPGVVVVVEGGFDAVGVFVVVAAASGVVEIVIGIVAAVVLAAPCSMEPFSFLRVL